MSEFREAFSLFVSTLLSLSLHQADVLGLFRTKMAMVNPALLPSTGAFTPGDQTAGLIID